MLTVPWLTEYNKYAVTSERHLQLSGKQSAHFGHVVIITVDSVVHLFFAVLPFAWAVWRRPTYVGDSSGQGGCPGLICEKVIISTKYLIKFKTKFALAEN